VLAGTASGTVAGVLYRGALDSTAVPLAAAAVAAPQTRNAHVAEHAALEAGLACAGGATLLGHPLPAECAEALGAALEHGTPAALASTLDGSAAMVLTGPELADVTGSLGRAELDSAAADTARARLRRGATLTERTEEFLLDLWVPVPSVLIVGSGAIGAALAAQAALLGWTARAVGRRRRDRRRGHRLHRRRRPRPPRPRPGVRRRADRGAARARLHRRARLPAHPVRPARTPDRRGRHRGRVRPALRPGRPRPRRPHPRRDGRLDRRAGRRGARGPGRGRARRVDEPHRRMTATVPTAAPPRVSWVGRLVLGALVVALFVVGGTAFRVWQVARQDDRQPADAVVVLGAAQYDGQPSSIFAARLKHAAALYDDKLAPRIVTTGGGRPGDAYTEAEAGRRYLIKLGVPPSAVVAVPVGTDTLGSLQAVAARPRRTGGTAR
jgi:hypothetical protein